MQDKTKRTGDIEIYAAQNRTDVCLFSLKYDMFLSMQFCAVVKYSYLLELWLLNNVYVFVYTHMYAHSSMPLIHIKDSKIHKSLTSVQYFGMVNMHITSFWGLKKQE